VDIARALGSLKEKHPDIYYSWCDKQGRLRSSLAVFVNQEHVRYRQGLATELADGDEVYVVPMAAGGCSYDVTRQ
jgi:molybdopterin converting factor small subunit